VGEFMQVEDLTVDGLSRLIQRVFEDPRYRIRARHFRRVIAQTRGLDLAADVIERAFLTRADGAHVNAK
jgi:zeaxanthin glucosyltransferase